MAAGACSFALPERFLLFIGKLEENKGARLLVPAVAAARTGLPLVVLGEGSLAHALKFEATAAGVTASPARLGGARGRPARARGAPPRSSFPSLWPEPLSRVLLEALALGTPVAAMETGGTREILGGTEARPARHGRRPPWPRPSRASPATARCGTGSARPRAGAPKPSPRARSSRATRPSTGGWREGGAAEPLRAPPPRSRRDGARGLPPGQTPPGPRGRDRARDAPGHARGHLSGARGDRALRRRRERRHGRVLSRTVHYPAFAARVGETVADMVRAGAGGRRRRAGAHRARLRTAPPPRRDACARPSS